MFVLKGHTKQRVTKKLNIYNGRSGGTDEYVINRMVQNIWECCRKYVGYLQERIIQRKSHATKY
jgi:hypothetical protein